MSVAFWVLLNNPTYTGDEDKVSKCRAR